MQVTNNNQAKLRRTLHRLSLLQQKNNYLLPQENAPKNCFTKSNLRTVVSKADNVVIFIIIQQGSLGKNVRINQKCFFTSDCNFLIIYNYEWKPPQTKTFPSMELNG